MLVPQERFLDFIAGEAGKYPHFRLALGAKSWTTSAAPLPARRAFDLVFSSVGIKRRIIECGNKEGNLMATGMTIFVRIRRPQGAKTETPARLLQ